MGDPGVSVMEVIWLGQRNLPEGDRVWTTMGAKMECSPMGSAHGKSIRHHIEAQ